MRHFLSLFVFLLSACQTVQVPNTKFCGAAGVISAGADCAWTLSDKTEEMTMDEFLDFLEPNETKAAALCQSASDAEKNFTALQQACRMLGDSCTYEIKQQLRFAASRIRALTTWRRK